MLEQAFSKSEHNSMRETLPIVQSKKAALPYDRATIAGPKIDEAEASKSKYFLQPPELRLQFDPLVYMPHRGKGLFALAPQRKVPRENAKRVSDYIAALVKECANIDPKQSSNPANLYPIQGSPEISFYHQDRRPISLAPQNRSPLTKHENDLPKSKNFALSTLGTSAKNCELGVQKYTKSKSIQKNPHSMSQKTKKRPRIGVRDGAVGNMTSQDMRPKVVKMKIDDMFAAGSGRGFEPNKHYYAYA